MDYIDYSPSTKILTLTRNPFGFETVERNGIYKGVTQQIIDLTDEEFEKRIIQILKSANIDIFPKGIKINFYKSLPDKLEIFNNWFIDSSTGKLKNEELFKKRIMGLTSYFRSAQEELLPKYEKITDFHIIKIPMSNYQFSIYEIARKEERTVELRSKQKKAKKKDDEFIESSSTYRIFSRLFCNFVMPQPPGRPMPREDTEIKHLTTSSIDKETIDNYKEEINEVNKIDHNDPNAEDDGQIEGDLMIEKTADATYEKRIKC
jgi:hypothetical protein